RELVAVELADDDGPGGAEACGHGGVVGGHEALEDAGARGGAESRRADDVLHPDRHAAEQTRILPRGDAAIDRLGRRDGLDLADREECPYLRLDGGDARQGGARELDGGDLPSPHAGGRLDERQLVEGAHSMMRGTRKNRPWLAGAFANGSSPAGGLVATSSRR